jgi:hypothetical protein
MDATNDVQKKIRKVVFGEGWIFLVRKEGV